MLTWAQQLLGETLEGGWKVVTALERPKGASGGCFSRSYVVESASGRQAFVKALDYSEALSSPDPATQLHLITSYYTFERDLCERCRTSGLSRVVKILTHGKHFVQPSNHNSLVQYLVFELAATDVRGRLDTMERLDTAWALRALHHVATGLKQLHGIGVAHQDLKPSNVLVFPDDSSKVGDLGRCTAKGQGGPFDDVEIVGDRSYAPPELLYGHIEPDWHRRRLGCDAYLLGSMVVFLFARASMTSLIMKELYDQHRPEHWGDTYTQVLPYVRDAFGRAVETFGTRTPVPSSLSDELSVTLRQLCEPDPALRGYPRNRGTPKAQYDLQTYISQFDRLARKVEYGLIEG